MKILPLTAGPLREELKYYLKITEKEHLKIRYWEQSLCFFQEVGNLSQADLEQGYILHQNKIYYKNTRSKEFKFIVELTTEKALQLKKNINYEFNDQKPTLISLSQTTFFYEFIEPQDFLTLREHNGQLYWSFVDNFEYTLKDNEQLPPILSHLYDTIKAYNDHYAVKNKSKVTRTDTGSDIAQNKDIDYFFAMPSLTFKQQLLAPFNWMNSAAKTLGRFFIFDNVIFKHTIGWLIAAIANHGNPYYKTDLGTLTDILRNIIFAGGSKKPQIDQNGDILLEPTLSQQFLALWRSELHRNKQTGTIEYKLDKDTIEFSEFFIQMPDGSQVAGVEANNSFVKQSHFDEVTHIIAFNGNSGCYQEELPYDAHCLKACAERKIPVKLIRFNYPGVLNSTGLPYNTHDLIQAGIAQVLRLLKQGVKPQNIQLHGFSLGGSIASHVASFFYAREQTLGGCCVSRTFSSTTNVGLSYIRKIPHIGSFLGYILRPALALGLWGTEWQLDTAKYFSRLPDATSWYTVAHTSKATQQLYKQQGERVKDDDVLVYDVSLHRSWRLQFKRFCIKHLGLFGYKTENYQRMNAAHKVIAALYINSSNAWELGYSLCAHADVHPFGLQSNNEGEAISQVSYSGRNYFFPKLFLRAKQTTGAPLIKTLDSNIQIQQELGEQTIDFIATHAVKGCSCSGQFFNFFKVENERSLREKRASNVVQTVMNWIP